MRTFVPIALMLVACGVASGNNRAPSPDLPAKSYKSDVDPFVSAGFEWQNVQHTDTVRVEIDPPSDSVAGLVVIPGQTAVCLGDDAGFTAICDGRASRGRLDSQGQLDPSKVDYFPISPSCRQLSVEVNGLSACDRFIVVTLRHFPPALGEHLER
jgi:hypothetical protein